MELRLKQTLQQQIEISTSVRNIVKFKGSGDFKDKAFLDNKYKDRPEELHNIYLNARTMTHPDRKVNLKDNVYRYNFVVYVFVNKQYVCWDVFHVFV